MNKHQQWLKDNLSVTNADQWNNSSGNWVYEHPIQVRLIESFLLGMVENVKDDIVAYNTFIEQRPNIEGIEIIFYNGNFRTFNDLYDE